MKCVFELGPCFFPSLCLSLSSPILNPFPPLTTCYSLLREPFSWIDVAFCLWCGTFSFSRIIWYPSSRALNLKKSALRVVKKALHSIKSVSTNLAAPPPPSLSCPILIRFAVVKRLHIFLYSYIYIHIHIYICVYICICLHVHVYICTYYIHKCAYILCLHALRFAGVKHFVDVYLYLFILMGISVGVTAIFKGVVLEDCNFNACFWGPCDPTWK